MRGQGFMWLPGESVAVDAVVQVPAPRRDYVLQMTMVQEGVTWFVDKKGIPLTVFITVIEG